ncbi:MAG: S1C family serine protease [Planctomycetota bacterium]
MTAAFLTVRPAWRLVILLSAGLAVFGSPLEAASAAGPREPGETKQAPSSESKPAPPNQTHWLEKLAAAMTGHETSPHARSETAVLEAFQESVAFPAKCMVRVLCDDEQVALGTIIDPDGLIVTKGSELAERVVCQLRDGTRHPARLLGIDHGSDLALLRIPAQDLPAIRWSDGDDPSVGGWVVTPGLAEVPRAIGIVSVASHRVRGGVLGIQMTEDQPGPRVTYVVPGSGAAEAGLSRGDVIVRANGKPMERSDDMVNTTSQMLPGDEIELSILRHGEKKRITASLGSVANTLSSRRARFQSGLGTPLSKRRFLFPAAMQHDSELTPNQCGGVLVNLDGEAIGVNIARASRIGCYAIPAEVVRPILKSLAAREATSVTLPVATRATQVPARPNAVDMELEASH